MPPRDHPLLSREQLNNLLSLAQNAAHAIREHYSRHLSAARNGGHGAVEVIEKEDNTPLTAADLASHRILSAGLRELTPEFPVLSEESSSSSIAERRSWRRFWMVDPLDGTREFLEKSGEFTINIALIDAGRPVIGLLYEPVADAAHLGIPGQGAWRLRNTSGEWRAEVVQTRGLADHSLTLLSSRRHRNERLQRAVDFLELSYSVQRLNSGSALKFCDLAAGRGDCYPRFSPCSEWDVAAGDALVLAAGGAVLGLDGKPLEYNARETLLSPHFVAVGQPRVPLWSELLAAVR